jgi:putative protein-disulfide isomerase
MAGDLEIIYVGDPMCSWCWGIAPELDELKRRHPELPFRVMVGGLRPGPHAEVMTEQMAEFLAREWRQIHQRTGQMFDYSLLERRDWLYDTEPACRAVAVMRVLDEPLAWPLFKRIQRAFYAEALLPTDPEVYPRLVEDIGGRPGLFMEAFLGPDSQEAAWRDFAAARSWGINSFPTVILREGEHGRILTVGYAGADQMDDALAASLDPPAFTSGG